MMLTGLRRGPLGRDAFHLCIDMQNIFAEPTPWHVPWLVRVLPFIEQIATRHPDRNIFTRFITPPAPGMLPGAWRGFYERWSEMLQGAIAPRLLELVPSLAALAPFGSTFDKMAYSPFSNPDLLAHLRRRSAGALIVTGVETDVCVLSGVLRAVDEGFRVVVVKDGTGSSSDATHDALLQVYATRLSEQIELVDAETILTTWL